MIINIAMDVLGDIEIRIYGKNGGREVTPELYDIRDIKAMIADIENLLFPDSKYNRPLICYDISKGSVVQKFQTSMQHIVGMKAILLEVNQSNSIDFLQGKSAIALENIQNNAIRNNYEFQLKTSLSEEPELFINSKTRFYRSEELWTETEFYLYGEIRDVGGSRSINIHLKTEEYGTLIINTDEKFLKSIPENMIFRFYGVRASGKQNVVSGEIDPKSLKLIDLFDYNASFDEDYLNGLIDKASQSWKGIQAEEWLNEIRGDYDE